MNAKLSGNHIYDAFLEPLEDGSYVHEGRTFHLAPCFWIFAGTDAPTAGKSQDHLSNKALDFESRLSHPIMHLGYAKSENNNSENPDHALNVLRRVEQIYIGVATIRAVFPEVTKISKKVLKAFSLIPPETVGPRGIRRLVMSLECVQYGRVMGNNLPEKWYQQMRIPELLVDSWREQVDSEDLLVEIRSQALLEQQ